MNWIKIEVSTPTKPEVMAIATRLNIPHAHAFGLALNWFIWCDENVTDGYIPHLKPSHIDGIVGHENFGNALVMVDWIKEDDGGILVVNHDRHMSQSAKKRSLKSERQRRWRERKTQ